MGDIANRPKMTTRKREEETQPAGTRAATAATGPIAQGQLPPPQMEGTTRGATADLSPGTTGRDPDCNMASPTRGAKEERAPTAGAGPAAARAPPAREEAEPRSKEALGGVRAAENHRTNTVPGETREEASGRLSPPAPPPAANDGTGSEGVEAKWSPGWRGIIRGQELWKLLKERRKDPNRSAW